ncbi:D-sedoheptulose-7-phosphate isomerase [Turneriella parva]|uniref:Phosphoheptose isomerase n=1 Tax=Turneriella parva (strain ATCC BAA-1111 / DSM 21527 / NCTC 11395 / H) TaxID=869212 RepID=I4B1K0_TURPD|nr:D-sedoheptulose 7-phosphate isomerase [Turneriella parva]AFM11157.1 phosphoheptose isomerase [Turneriella parva DSM 21527]
MKDYIRAQVKDSISVKERYLADEANINQLDKICADVIAAYKAGKKTLIAGNGGSAADAQHIAAEFVSRFYFDRPALASIALTTDTSALTAIGNDYGYELLFSRQLEANAQPGDIYIAISTSGNSKNVLHSLEVAKKIGLKTIGLTGMKGGKMADMVDYCVRVPSDETPRIQECHILIGHILCAAVEKELFEKEYRK